MIRKLRKTNIGKTITLLRKRAGLTQKNLADKLFISDKAVSKWERGLSYPDVAFINKLAKIFDIDTDALFVEEDKSIVSSWVGVLYFPSGANNVKFRDKICDKYILEIVICYYLLASISNIFVIFDGDNFRFTNAFVSKLKVQSLNIKILKTEKKKKKKNILIKSKFENVMLIYDLFFIYGVGLTSSFQRAMLDKSKMILLSNPKLPVAFGPREMILNMIDKNDYIANATTINLFRGYLVIDLNSVNSVRKCEKLFRIIKNVSGNTLYDIDEIVRIRQL